MLALERSGCRLAWNNLPNEQTVLFVFKDAGRPLDSPLPCSSHLFPNLLVKAYAGRGFGLGFRKVTMGSHLAHLETELELEVRGGGRLNLETRVLGPL